LRLFFEAVRSGMKFYNSSYAGSYSTDMILGAQ